MMVLFIIFQKKAKKGGVLKNQGVALVAHPRVVPKSVKDVIVNANQLAEGL